MNTARIDTAVVLEKDWGQAEKGQIYILGEGGGAVSHMLGFLKKK